jgi:hypothetical protein
LDWRRSNRSLCLRPQALAEIEKKPGRCGDGFRLDEAEQLDHLQLKIVDGVENRVTE